MISAKGDLRSRVRQLKKQHSALQLSTISADICQRIMLSADYQNAATILLYHPLPDEVDTRILIDDAYNNGKKVILPVVAGCDLQLRIYSPGAMAQGAFGIQEPTGELFTDYGEISLAIIPGMGFDARCHRLGRGKGYYDRLLPKLANARKVGVCFGFQYLADIPCEPHDVLMDSVVWG